MHGVMAQGRALAMAACVAFRLLACNTQRAEPFAGLQLSNYSALQVGHCAPRDQQDAGASALRALGEGMMQPRVGGAVGQGMLGDRLLNAL